MFPSPKQRKTGYGENLCNPLILLAVGAVSCEPLERLVWGRVVAPLRTPPSLGSVGDSDNAIRA